MKRIDSDDLEVDADTVLILRNCGPVAEGMPEWGSIPIPRKLSLQGITDMVRISDARMSGTSYGTVILHVSPEAYVGGPLALVRTGDRIRLDVMSRKLELLVDERELSSRREAWMPPLSVHKRGYLRLFADQVLQAHEGCDLAFLRPNNPEDKAMIEPTVGKG